MFLSILAAGTTIRAVATTATKATVAITTTTTTTTTNDSRVIFSNQNDQSEGPTMCRTSAHTDVVHDHLVQCHISTDPTVIA